MAKSEWSYKTAVELSAALAAKKVSAVELAEDDSDPFSRLERQLRASDEQRGYEEVVASAPDERAIDQRVMAELEDWLAEIVIDREHRPTA